MPAQRDEPNPDHRLARAAGKATRSFLDASRRDSERARTERKEREERQAAEERAAERAEQERLQAEAARQAATPTVLKVARWWWCVATLVFALLAVSFLLAGLNAQASADNSLDFADPTGSRAGQFVLGAAAGVLTVASGIGAVQLLRSRRSASGLLTGVAVIVGIPMIVRGHPVLIAVAAVLLVGAALLWLPPVRRYLR